MHPAVRQQLMTAQVSDLHRNAERARVAAPHATAGAAKLQPTTARSPATPLADWPAGSPRSPPASASRPPIRPSSGFNRTSQNARPNISTKQALCVPLVSSGC